MMDKKLFPNAQLSPSDIYDINVNELGQQIEKDPNSIQVIDVRRHEELISELGMLKSAKHCELTLSFKEDLEQFDKNKTTIFVCRSGQRSITASQIALENGFTEVYNLFGGMIAINQSDYIRLKK